ncbi:MAG: hypothetical protein IPM85_00015 [Chitinophagaceae bacterium]|nr:hypothetical protein [Chitinophagaceae bacterium]
MRDKHGNWHWLYCKESVFEKSRWNTQTIFGITVDITDRKNKEALLARKGTPIAVVC